jgi:hypothetical protein
MAAVAVSLPARGPAAIVEFIWAAIAACVSAAAAWALLSRAPAAQALARVAIALSLARTLQSLAWTALPSDVIPGTRAVLAGLAIACAAGLWEMNERAGARA